MSLLRSSAVLAIFLAGAPVPAARDGASDQLFERGKAAYQGGDHVRAVENLFAFREAMRGRLSPDGARLLDAAIAASEGQLELALETRRKIGDADQVYLRVAVAGKVDSTGTEESALRRVHVGSPVSANALPPLPQSATAETLAGSASNDLRVLETVRKFAGSYSGFDDGVPATLRISVSEDAGGLALQLQMTEPTRGVTLGGVHRPRIAAADQAHALRGIELRSADGNVTKRFELLLLHTWDENHLTAVTEWNGRPFGASFARN